MDFGGLVHIHIGVRPGLSLRIKKVRNRVDVAAIWGCLVCFVSMRTAGDQWLWRRKHPLDSPGVV